MSVETTRCEVSDSRGLSEVERTTKTCSHGSGASRSPRTHASHEPCLRGWKEKGFKCPFNPSSDHRDRKVAAVVQQERVPGRRARVEGCGHEKLHQVESAQARSVSGEGRQKGRVPFEV